MLVASTYSPLCAKDFGYYERELWFVKLCKSVSAAVSEMKLLCSNWFGPTQRTSHSLRATLHLHRCRLLWAFPRKARAKRGESVWVPFHLFYKSCGPHRGCKFVGDRLLYPSPSKVYFKSWLSKRNMERQCDQFCRCWEGDSTVSSWLESRRIKRTPEEGRDQDFYHLKVTKRVDSCIYALWSQG